MRLNPEELLELKKGKPVALWRWHDPKFDALPIRRSCRGIEFTIVSVQALAPSEVMRHHSKATYEILRSAWPEGQAVVWRLTTWVGDRTDRPRFMARAGGKSGDYTYNATQALSTEEALKAEDLKAFADKAQPGIEAKQAARATARRRRRKLRSAQDLLRKALDEAS